MSKHKYYTLIGYRYGRSGKVYSSRAKAERQGRAIHASQRRREVSGYSDRRREI